MTWVVVHGGAVLFLIEAVLAGVAIRADGGIELRTVAAGDDVLGPVVIDLSGWERRKRRRRRGDLGRAVLIGEADDSVGIGDIEIVADQRHAERRMEVLQKNRPRLRGPIAILIAQQGDAVGALDAGAGASHDMLHEPAAKPAHRFAWAVGFRHQHVAVRQHIQPARMIETAGIRRDAEAPARHRHAAVLPPRRRRDIQRRNQRLPGRWQLRVVAIPRRRLLLGRRVRLGAEGHAQRRNHCENMGK